MRTEATPRRRSSLGPARPGPPLESSDGKSTRPDNQVGALRWAILGELAFAQHEEALSGNGGERPGARLFLSDERSVAQFRPMPPVGFDELFDQVKPAFGIGGPITRDQVHSISPTVLTRITCPYMEQQFARPLSGPTFLVRNGVAVSGLFTELDSDLSATVRHEGWSVHRPAALRGVMAG